MEFRGVMGGFYRLSEWVMRLAVINLLWLLCSLPCVAMLVLGWIGAVSMATEQEAQAALIFPLIISAVLAPFTLFPATTAMFTVARKWVTGNEDVPLFRTYFQGYKENWKASMIGGIVYVVLFAVLTVNHHFYAARTDSLQVLAILFVALGVFLLISVFYFFSIQVHLHMKPLQVVKNSLMITIGQPIRSLFIAATNGFVLYVSFLPKLTFLIPFFSGSVIAYMTFWHFQAGFVRMQQRMKANQETAEETAPEDELPESGANANAAQNDNGESKQA